MTIKHKPATIINVAKMASVSTATVSFVLNNKTSVRPETRARVLQAMKELNYQPNLEARRLGRSRRNNQPHSQTRIILFLTYEKTSDHMMFERDYMEGFLEAAERVGYRIMIGRTGNAEDKFMNMRNIDADGVITNIMLPEMVNTLSAVCPVVIVGSFLPEGRSGSVIPDNQGGIRQAVKHLVDLGHRSIGFMSSNPAHPCYREREIGYRTALVEYGLECESKFIGQGNNLTAYLRQKPLPTAIVCTNDGMASNVLCELSVMNIKAPDQVSVTGFDDIDIARHTSPPLTTVHVPRAKLAALAVEHLVRKINNPALGDYQIVAPVTLSIRGSTGPINRPIKGI